MPKVKKSIDPGIVISLIRTIYVFLRPWLKKMAEDSSTPVDNWMLDMLDLLLGVE